LKNGKILKKKEKWHADEVNKINGAKSDNAKNVLFYGCRKMAVK